MTKFYLKDNTILNDPYEQIKETYEIYKLTNNEEVNAFYTKLKKQLSYKHLLETLNPFTIVASILTFFLLACIILSLIKGMSIYGLIFYFMFAAIPTIILILTEISIKNKQDFSLNIKSVMEDIYSMYIPVKTYHQLNHLWITETGELKPGYNTITNALLDENVLISDADEMISRKTRDQLSYENMCAFLIDLNLNNEFQKESGVQSESIYQIKENEPSDIVDVLPAEPLEVINISSKNIVDEMPAEPMEPSKEVSTKPASNKHVRKRTIHRKRSTRNIKPKNYLKNRSFY